MKKNLFLILSLLLVTVQLQARGMKLYHKVEMQNHTQSSAIDYAIKALSQDFNRKFGTPIPLPERETITLNFEIAADENRFDQFEINFGKNNINFVGTDELGLIHSIYTFSEDVLGVDPFIHFTHLMPDLAKEIEVSTKTIQSKPYTYTHRGFFINDEDLVEGFQLEKLSYGFNLDFMQKIYETSLRLKMTGIIPSTLILADEPHLKLASDMGLYIMQHHAEPVGSVPLFWPKNELYSWSTNREEFIRFWSEAIERNAGKNVIWTLGFRGFLDRDFWVDDPVLKKDATDQEKAAIINEVIQTQYDLIKEITGNPDPLVSGIMWGAVRGLYNKGLIKFPPTTMIQFADTGFGVFPESVWDDAEKCDLPMGVYQHVSYHNRGAHMRINLLDPNMLCREMQKAYDHNLTSICVLNVGNMKEKVFGIQQMVNYMNDFEQYKDQKNNEYYAWYVQDKFKTSSPAIVQAYQDFINNHFSLIDDVRKPGDEFYSLFTEKAMGMLYTKEVDNAFLKGNLPKEVYKEVSSQKDDKSKMQCAFAYYTELLDSVSQKWEISQQRAFDAQSELSGNKLDFYRSDVMLPTQKMYQLTSMAADLSRAANSYLAKEYHQAQLSTYAAIQHAAAAMEVEQKIEDMHTGDFKDWYRYDENALTRSIQPYLEHFIEVCKDMKYITLPYEHRNSKTPGVEYKYQPFFDSQYRNELMFMENAQ